jgi:hypothetical protein
MFLLQITAHVSCCKYTPAGDLASLWRENLNSFIEFLAAVQQGNTLCLRSLNIRKKRGIFDTKVKSHRQSFLTFQNLCSSVFGYKCDSQSNIGTKYLS